MALIGRPRSRREWCTDAVLFTLLGVAALVLANRAGREHLRSTLDLSEERLAVPSPTGAAMLAGLDDVLDVRAYFTGSMKIGPAQIAKRRLVDALERWEDLAGGRMRLSFSDPNDSTEERVEARALGVASVPIPASQGTSEVTQEVFLGLRLRLRGREAVIPWVLPQTLEQEFFGELFWLQRAQRPVLGLVGGQGPDFAPLRGILAERYELRELTTLAHADPVPPSVDVVLVVAPELVHPRTAYEVARFVEGGGRALFLVDPLVVDPRAGKATVRPTGFEDVLAAWGAAPSDQLVWDARRSNRIRLTQIVEEGGVRREEVVPLEYPPWPNVGVDGLAEDSPITASVSGASLFWAAALEGSAPAGVEREVLLTTTPEHGYLVPLDRALELDAESLARTNLELAAKTNGRALPLAVSLRGTLPTAYLTEAPVPVDAVAEARFRSEVEAARASFGPWPERAVGTIPVDELGAKRPTAVVVVGDADLVRKSFLESNPVNGQLVANAVDWLALSPELLALRARRPKERAIVDWLGEEREARGLGALVGGLDPDEARRVSALEEDARGAAERRRWTLMGATLAGALALAGLGAFATRWLLVRGTAR